MQHFNRWAAEEHLVGQMLLRAGSCHVSCRPLVNTGMQARRTNSCNRTSPQPHVPCDWLHFREKPEENGFNTCNVSLQVLVHAQKMGFSQTECWSQQQLSKNSKHQVWCEGSGRRTDSNSHLFLILPRTHA